MRPLFFAITALEGIYFFYRLLNAPRSPQGGLAAIVSIALIVLSMILVLALLAAAYHTWRWTHQRPARITEKNLRTIILISLAVIPLSYTLHHNLHSLYLGSGNAIYRLAFLHLDPFLLWAGLAAVQFLAWLALTRSKKLSNLWIANRKLYRTALLVWSIFLILALVVRISGLRVPETSMTAWAIPAVPLLEWHLWLSGLIAALFFVLERCTQKSTTGQNRFTSLLRSDRFWFFLIWGLSLVIWADQPLLPNQYATPGRPPNFEVYPFSDGMFYDQTAQSILIGNGLMGDQIPARPLYTVFLAILHGIAGQGYLHVILVQTVVLAVFPAVLYLLGKEFGSRSAGIMAALLTIFREIHSIQAAPFTRSVANVKLYFSEIPTALGLSLFLLFCLRWLKKHENPGLYPILAGGMLGITMLIRTQSLAVFPFVLLFALVTLWPDWKKLVVPAALLLAALAVTIAPWLYRNYQITGKLVFDHPMSQTWEMARRYAYILEEDPWEVLERQPGENDGDFAQRLTEYTFTAMLTHPGFVVQTIGANLANGELTSLLTLSIRPVPIQEWGELLRSRSSFWQQWPQDLSFHITLLLTMNLGLIALGISAAWRKLKWAALIPLSMNLMYNLATAAFQVSGMRFVLPVTWVVHLYYALGLLALVELLWQALTQTSQAVPVVSPPQSPTTSSRELQWWQALAGLFLFALISSSLILAEIVIPKKFPPQSEAQILTELQGMSVVQQDPDLDQALDAITPDNDLIILKGRALYPRFYAQDEVEPNTAKTAYATLSYPRMVFFFLSETTNETVVLPAGQVPEHFPHTMDMILIGCQQGSMIEARMVAPLDKSGILYTSNLKDTLAPCEP